MLAHADPAPAFRRPIDLLALSDCHLGTRHCRGEELAAYLAGIAPREVVLNGDIVDLRELSRSAWKRSHTAVVQRLLDWARAGIPVTYVTGNHDALLRFASAFSAGHIAIVDGLERVLAGRRTFFTHGDVVEKGLCGSRWLRKAACVAWKLAEHGEHWGNHARRLVGLRPWSLARAVRRLPGARRHIERYEEACAAFAAAHGYDAIVTGHIHVPMMRALSVGGRTVDYLNCGDWVESCSALEFHAGEWRLVEPYAATPRRAAEPFGEAMAAG